MPPDWSGQLVITAPDTGLVESSLPGLVALAGAGQRSVSAPGWSPLTRSTRWHTETADSVNCVRNSPPIGVARGQFGLVCRLDFVSIFKVTFRDGFAATWAEQSDSKPIYDRLTDYSVSVSGTRPPWHEEITTCRTASVVVSSQTRRSLPVISIGRRQAAISLERTLPSLVGAQRSHNE